MESKKDIDLLLKRIKSATKLNQSDIAKRIKYSREYLSQAKKTKSDALYDLLEQEFQKELSGTVVGEPGDKLNSERALMVAMLEDYASYKAQKEGLSFESVKSEIKQKARLVLGGLDSWLP